MPYLNRIISVLFGSIIICVVSKAQDSNYNVYLNNTDSLQYNYFMERLQEQFNRRREIITAASRSEKSLLERRDALRANFKKMVGELPPESPLNPKINWERDMGSYTVKGVAFESWRNHHVTGLFYLPKKGDGPFPAVYIATGHSPQGKAAQSYQMAARLFALNGFAVLQADPVCQGERHQLINEQGKPKTRGGTLTHEFFGQALLLTGSTILVNELYDNIRCIDFLEQHPKVDKERLAVTGISGGGTQTTFLTAYDRRIKASAPVCFIATSENKFEVPLVPDWCQWLWRQGKDGIEEQDYLLMAAPTPIQILSAEEDFFPIEGARQAVRELNTQYEVLGIPERIDHRISSGKHSWHKPLRESAVQWCKRWLMNDNSQVVEPENIGFFNPSEAMASPTGQVLTSFENERTIVDIIQDRVTACEYHREKFQNEHDLNEVLEKVKALIGFEEPGKTTEVKNLGTIIEKGYRVEKLLLERDKEKGFSLPALLFIPEGIKDKNPARIIISEKGKNSLLNDESELFNLLAKGHIVLTVDITDTGELEDRIRKTVSKNSVFTPKFPLYEGKTIIGYRTEDILIAARFLQKHNSVDNKQISLSSTGNTSYAAIHAGVLSGYFNRLYITGELQSWESMALEPYTSYHQLWRLGNIIPDVLNYYDVPDLKSMCEKKNIQIIQRRE